jgi:hypothetical protein
MVRCGLIEGKKDLAKSPRERYSNLPAGVSTGSFDKEVGGDFVRI